MCDVVELYFFARAAKVLLSLFLTLYNSDNII